MGLFSLFRKADAPAPSDDEAQARLAAGNEAVRLGQQARQRELPLATALKIDAIEAAMALDMFSGAEPAWGSQRAPRPPRPPSPADDDGVATTLLLSGDALPQPAAAAENAQLVEEIAILYANGQLPQAQQMLTAAVADGMGKPHGERTAWWMLFDLYQVSGQQDAFDNLSIDYASTFETSPPPWTAPARPAAAAAPWSGLTPTEPFAGALDAHIAPQLARLRQAAADSPVLRLEFSRVTAVTADGCALLLDTLHLLQRQQRELIVVGAPGLTALLREGIAPGRRDDGAAPWLLLLELLQLQQREKDFEQTAMDYCVTFEVSPPSYTAPRQVAMAPEQHLSASPDRFMLPPVIEQQLGPLLSAIRQYAEQYPALVFDCARLTRLDYASALQLHALLAALAPGRKIAFRDVNHLVAALLRLLGFGSLARIYAHKY